MKLNCDLGESFGAWAMGRDAEVMPFIDQANIACGFHAGDPVVLNKTLALAAEHGVAVGAHPAYPDLNGFGRRSIPMSANELRQLLHYQISAISGMARVQGLTVDYVKPHGALYNDMMKNESIRTTVMQAVADYPEPLTLMLQATADHERHQQEASQYQLPLWFEAFADRAYQANGRLVPRSEADAVLNAEQILSRIDNLVNNQTVIAVDGTLLRFPVDSVCVHGDNDTATQLIADIRERIRAHQC
ncbi:5-oxoprolinase subunit PxpA [Reinekea blandensis]|uniref:LamB/YcsF family protein n=1 Tax=Reinekea blandensis MED297 TaxID=314283 RepID=A4B8Y3_9GAMM|nr:5-oxoprolinase subunit PxpA [Reinekea blandensis]EAR11084.1 LamB/YcsF family protein [Reinekea sp. MED297] [Reinekea blandensis MED297]